MNKLFKEYPLNPKVYNIRNPVSFTVSELKEFSEEFAARVMERGNKEDMTGFWSLCKEMFNHKFEESGNTKHTSKGI
jgi:hypothetical protein